MTSPVSVLSFRNELDEKVLEWGWLYFNNGWVSVPKEILPGKYEVVIHESTPHALTFAQSWNNISDYFCTCGQSHRSVCRHLAALLFYLEAGLEKNN
jgi:uncharacterized Zn finger protein